jgi:predicted AlkP superfamily pyrophosphatase or phosphodiesterase
LADHAVIRAGVSRVSSSASIVLLVRLALTLATLVVTIGGAGSSDSAPHIGGLPCGIQIASEAGPAPTPAESPALGDVPGAGHTFKIRIGTDALKSARYVVWDSPSIDVIKVRRYAGSGSVPIRITSEIVEGNPALWTVSIQPSSFDLGPPPTRSSGDVDEPGTIPGRFGDGDVDEADLAAFESHFTGDGNPLSRELAKVGIRFDFDGDLDVDEADRAVLLSHSTGPVAVPWNRELELQVSAAPAAPQEASARIRITATNPLTGEERSTFAHATKRSLQPELAMWIDRSTRVAPRVQLAQGGPVNFLLGLSNRGASRGTFDVRVLPVDGFSFRVINWAGVETNTFSLDPQTGYRLGPQPGLQQFRLEVTPPQNWPIGARQKVTLEASSPDTGAAARLGVEVINAGPLWNPSALNQQSGRRHRVHPGGTTSFRMMISNPLKRRRTFALNVEALAGGNRWTIVTDPPTVTLRPGAQAAVLVSVTAPLDAAPGSTADWEVRLLNTGGRRAVPRTRRQSRQRIARPIASNRVGAEVTDKPRVYFFALDGVDPGLLELNSRGTGPGAPGDWLMPRVHAWLGRATFYLNATASPPYVTDNNHMAVLTGSYPGNTGVHNVLLYYSGRDADGASVGLSILDVGTSLMRFGPNGTRAETIFDVAHQMDPAAHTAMALSKGWLKLYLRNEVGSHVDVVLEGGEQPLYVEPPEYFVMGDPPTDDDPSDPSTYFWNVISGFVPEDRWVLDGALRIIDTEAPEVMYVLLGGVDDMSHAVGGTADLAEWDDRGTETTWDDRSRISPAASREDVLDTVREVDNLFGLFVDHLAHRGELDDAYVVLLSDHGEVTHRPYFLDIASLLESHGYGNMDDFRILSGSGAAGIYDVAPEEVQRMEDILETAPSIAPGLDHNPWIVINRQEMRTGVDARTGVVFSAPGELYSEYYAEHDGSPGMPQWPELALLADGNWEFSFAWPVYGEDGVIRVGPFELGLGFMGGHGGPATAPALLAVSGPNLPRGRIVSDPVRLVDVAPTLYGLLGWPTPANVQGQPLP